MSSTLLVSTYALGQQPVALAQLGAMLQAQGERVQVWDASLDPLPRGRWQRALIWTPMHTALSIGVEAAAALRVEQADLPISYFGMYAQLNREHLERVHGAAAVYGPHQMNTLVEDITGRPATVAAREADRTLLPPLKRYVHLHWRGKDAPVGFVQASSGCKYHCTHCPLPPLFEGRFRATPRETVANDIAALVASGAEHITFGDPDFLNGPSHALRIARELHAAHPQLSFDFTAKIEHLVKHAALLEELVQCGALFVVSAAESLNDTVLQTLDKGHVRADIDDALRACRAASLTMRPTFVPFTPWESYESYRELLEWIAQHELINHVDSVQLAVRLLVPPGSLLEHHPAFAPHRGELEAFRFHWTHPDPRMDALQRDVSAIIEAESDAGRAYQLIRAAAGLRESTGPSLSAAPPRLTEPWFC